MTPGGFCYVQNTGRAGFHVIHVRSNLTEAIIYAFVKAYAAAETLARDCNLEISARLHAPAMEELRRKARLMMQNDTETFSEG